MATIEKDAINEREDREASSVKRIKVVEDKEVDDKIEKPKAHVFGGGAKGFGSLTKGAGWLVPPSGGAVKPFSFASSQEAKPFSFGGGGPGFGTNPSSSKSNFSFTLLSKPPIEDKKDEPSKDITDEKDNGEDEEESENNGFDSQVEGMAPARLLKTARDHGVVMPDEINETVTGEEGENVLLTLRAKLFVLVPKDMKVKKVIKKQAEQEEHTSTSEETGEQKKESEDNVQNEWRECGVGTLRLLVPKEGKGGRLVMRREKTESLILNTSLVGVHPVRVAEKAASFSCLRKEGDVAVTATYLIKLKLKDDVQHLIDLVNSTQKRDLEA